MDEEYKAPEFPGLVALANSPRPLPNFSKKRDGFDRKEVLDNLQRAFDLTGGISRFALWANANYTEFAKLYVNKGAPASTINLVDNRQVTIFHALPPTALDRHEQPAVFVDRTSGAIVPGYVEITKEMIDGPEAGNDGDAS